MSWNLLGSINDFDVSLQYLGSTIISGISGSSTEAISASHVCDLLNKLDAWATAKTNSDKARARYDASRDENPKSGETKLLNKQLNYALESEIRKEEELFSLYQMRRKAPHFSAGDIRRSPLGESFVF